MSGMLFWRRVVPVILAFALMNVIAVVPASGQGTSATLSGTVLDETGAVVPGVSINVLNTETSLRRETTTGKDGFFSIPLLPPGRYSLGGQLDGFGPIRMDNIVLNVNDQIALAIRLKVAPIGQEVTVLAEGRRLSTSPAVSTVIDRQFVENLPLNGRSLHALLELTPGVVLTRPTVSNANANGQFSVNGQRENANTFTVDGVSANTGMIAGGFISTAGQSGSGQLPALTALGGTNGMVSVDALQEFRIQTSSYAAEFGRTPGAQISMVTRSGSNQFHGSVSEYFRDDKLDATDWFTNHRGQTKPELRQHSFGGVLGGPVLRNRTFFFGSYEGLRLVQPRAALVRVPTTAVRAASAPAVQALVNALPLPNGQDLGSGMAEFSASWSDPSELDSTSIRVDHNTGHQLTFFGRVGYATSQTQNRVRSLNQFGITRPRNTTVTAGSTWIVSRRIVHDLRVNYTSNRASFVGGMDDFGGAALPPSSIFAPGRDPDRSTFAFTVLPTAGWSYGAGTDFKQRQFQLVDSVTLTSTSHEWKFGVDFRRLNPLFSDGEAGQETAIFTVDGLATSRVLAYTNTVRDPNPRAGLFTQLSLYAQDNWRLTPRLTLTYGLRWEFVPPPHASEGEDPVTLQNLDNPYGGQVHVAARNTPLWDTQWANLAPRIGASYVILQRPTAQLLLKGGYGLFHDLNYGQVASSFQTWPFSNQRTASSVPFPIAPDLRVATPPRESAPRTIWVMDRHLKLPVTHGWNVSVEHIFATHQTLTISYVGANGRKLLKLDPYRLQLRDWPGTTTTVSVNRNRGYSDYGAMQVQFQRRLRRGLQALASYTLARSRDTSSSDNSSFIPAERLPFEVDYGYSDFDVRHAFTAAATYQLPTSTGSSLWRAVIRSWAIDGMVRARSGFPVNVSANVPFPPDNFFARANVVPGQPFWIVDSSLPGGRRLNPQAFSVPPENTQGDLMRGAVRGFGALQTDLAVRREFSLSRGMRLQVRAEMFNLFNTPNFRDPDVNLGSSSGFGRVTQTLATGFGQSALYQIGGSRSTQLAVKFVF